MRAALVALSLGMIVTFGYLSGGPPRITLLNASLVVEYPWPRGAAAVACALGVALAGAVLTRRALRRLAFVLAMGPLLVGGHLLAYRLEASGAALASRGILGTTTIAWREVREVEQSSADLLVRGLGSARIRIDTTDFGPEQRATLERTVARHVRENGGAGGIVTVPR